MEVNVCFYKQIKLKIYFHKACFVPIGAVSCPQLPFPICLNVMLVQVAAVQPLVPVTTYSKVVLSFIAIHMVTGAQFAVYLK